MSSVSDASGAATFESVEAGIAAHADRKCMGDAFERAVLHYLTHDPVVGFTQVWLWDDWDERIRLGLIRVTPRGVTGVGEVTGDVYRATGITQHMYNVDKAAETLFWWHNNFRLIGPGPDNNLHVKWRMRATINANGEVTAYIDRTEVKCL